MSVAAIVLPVFALIALGYVSARWRWLSEAAQKGLAEFATTLAIPALLFRTVANPTGAAGSPLAIWAAFFGALLIVWGMATLATRAALRRPLDDSAAIAMTSTYGNTVMMGIPLCLSMYGDAAAAPIAIILSIHTLLLWGGATLHHQWVTRADGGGRVGRLLVDVFVSLIRNPLIMAILAGVAWRTTGLGLAPLPEKTLALLAQAGIPAALVALGTSLAGFAIKGQGPTLSLVLVLKLLVMPALAALIGLMLALPPVALGVVIVFAAMPAGANAFLFAAKVERAVNSTSGAVALGTLLSIATVSAIVAWLTR